MLTKIFCEIDDFMKEFEAVYKSKLLSKDKKERFKNSKLSMSEIIYLKSQDKN